MPLMGHERRDAILQSLRGAKRPVSGTALASVAGVSRQVIVQDIALLRADGHDIVATNRGYVLREGASELSVPTRLIKFTTLSINLRTSSRPSSTWAEPFKPLW